MINGIHNTTYQIKLFDNIIANRENQARENLNTRNSADSINNDTTNENLLPRQNIMELIGVIMTGLTPNQRQKFDLLSRQILKIPSTPISDLNEITSILQEFTIKDLNACITLSRSLENSLPSDSELRAYLQDIKTIFKSLLRLKQYANKNQLTEAIFIKVASQLDQELEYNSDPSKKPIIRRLRDLLFGSNTKKACRGGNVASSFTSVSINLLRFHFAVTIAKAFAVAIGTSLVIAATGLSVVAFLLTVAITYGAMKLYQHIKLKNGVEHLSMSPIFIINGDHIKLIKQIDDKNSRKIVADFVIKIITQDGSPVGVEPGLVTQLQAIETSILSITHENSILRKPTTSENSKAFYKAAIENFLTSNVVRSNDEETKLAIS